MNTRVSVEFAKIINIVSFIIVNLNSVDCDVLCRSGLSVLPGNAADEMHISIFCGTQYGLALSHEIYFA